MDSSDVPYFRLVVLELTSFFRSQDGKPITKESARLLCLGQYEVIERCRMSGAVPYLAAQATAYLCGLIHAPEEEELDDDSCDVQAKERSGM